MNFLKIATTLIRWWRKLIGWPGARCALVCAVLCSTAFGQMGKDLCPVSQATHTAIKVQGSWQDAATWDNGVPGNGARVYIPCNHYVTNHATTADVQWIHCEGVLSVCDHCDTQINVHTLYVPEHGVVMLGSEDMPVTGKAVLEFGTGPTFDLYSDFLPGDWQKLSLGVICHGMFMSHGREKTAWKEIDDTSNVGAKQVTLRELVYQWEPGDQILIAGTDAILGEDETGRHRYQSEWRTISAIDSRTLKFADGLVYKHWKWREDLPYHCANLTRNVIIRSRDTSSINKCGHLMFMHSGVDMRYTAMIGLGRTDKSKSVTDPRKDANGVLVPGSDANPRARYAWHAHRVGVDKAPSRVIGCVVDGSPGWGFLCHDSHCDFDNCVAVRCFGAGFATEEGQERGHMRKCLSAMNHGLGDKVASTDADHGSLMNADFNKDGAGFWIHSGLCEVTDCVAFDNSGRGFGLFIWPMNDHPRYQDNRQHEWLKFPIIHKQPYLPPGYGTAASVPAGAVLVQVFFGNTAYHNKIGLQAWSPLFADGLPESQRGHVLNFTTWGRGNMVHLEYTHQLTLEGVKIVGDHLFRGRYMPTTNSGDPILVRRRHITITGLTIDGVRDRNAGWPNPRPISWVGTAGDLPTLNIEGTYPIMNGNTGERIR